jgi:DNA-binding MarR family transcriptional regulator
MATKNNRQDWLVLYNDFKKSGLSLRKWSKEKGISCATMSTRIQVLEKEGLIKKEKPVANRIDFVEVNTNNNSTLNNASNANVSTINSNTSTIKPNVISNGITATIDNISITLSLYHSNEDIIKFSKVVSSLC